MRNSWFFFLDLDGGSPYVLPTYPVIPQSYGSRFLPEFSSFMDDYLHQSRYLYVPGSMALQENFNCISKFAGALLFWFSSGSSSNMSREITGDQHCSKPGSCTSTQVKNITSGRHNLAGCHFSSRSKGESATPVVFGNISSFAAKCLFRESGRLQSCSVLSLAAALVPPFDNLSPEMLAVPQDSTDVEMHGCMGQNPCEVIQDCGGLSLSNLNWTRHAVEPRTGIQFPLILDNVIDGDINSSLMSEVLVGTGSRTMKIVKIKSLKVYAFGFYVHPYSVCEKLGAKYASIPVAELNKHREFYEDLLREDISMTVRLVVNCNGMKVNTVKNAFEKSLRSRLLKTNPNTDYHCLTTFGSYFTQDIPLPAGTTIDFRRTTDGKLITEIGGNQIGAVHSKDLCRAFFDMYIGDVPVSEQTKDEIGSNVASIIRRC